ncbi:MAG: hypothetical protein AB7G13_06515 [Lautropia sp.]
MSAIRLTPLSSSLALAGISLSILAGCAATPIEPAIVGYTCCNLHPEEGWVSSQNVQGGAVIPAGQRVRLDSIKRGYYVYGTIGGVEYALRNDSSKGEASTMPWVHRLVVPQDPRRQLADWPEPIRTAVRDARVSVGMTRAQVAMSLGYPSPDDTPNLSGATWRYWTAAHDLPVDLLFDAEQRLVRLTGKPEAVASLAAETPPEAAAPAIVSKGD